MNKLFTLLFVFASILVQAQYSTPGNGQAYTFAQLVSLSQGTVTLVDGNFHVVQNLTVTAPDTLLIDQDITVKLGQGRRIHVFGKMISDPPQQAMFTAINPEQRFEDIRLEDASGSVIRNTAFEYGVRLLLSSTDAHIDNCSFRFMSNLGGALNLTGNAKPVVENSLFELNAGSAIGSGANVISAATIRNNQLIHNNTSNGNRPQINMGPSAGDTLKIVGNTIIGQSIMAGGIAVSVLVGGNLIALVEGNHIENNRYGYAATGNNIMSIVRNNIIVDNNIQGEPNLGGSGLNFNGGVTNTALVRENIVRGNLWGVTIQGQATPNLGEEGNATTGFNVFENNINNSTIFGLYNNTTGAILAQHNYWGTDDEEVAAQYVVGQHQNPALGPVNFTPIWVPEAQILSFVFEAALNEGLDTDIHGEIDHENGIIMLEMPGGGDIPYDISALIPTIEVSMLATIDPPSGQPADFTDYSLVFTVTSVAGEEKTYEAILYSWPIEFELTLLASPGGAGTLTGEGLHPVYTYVEVSAQANEGFGFVEWTDHYGEVVSTESSFDYYLYENSTLTAHFIELIPQGYTVFFDIIDTSASPIENAIVTFMGLTQEPGSYHFYDVLPGTYSWSIEAEGYHSAEGELTVIDQDVSITVEMDIDTYVPQPAAKVFSIYPNPALDRIYIDFDQKAGQLYQARIFSMTGNLVLDASAINAGETVQLSGLQPGIYLLQFSGDDQTITRKLTIRR